VYSPTDLLQRHCRKCSPGRRPLARRPNRHRPSSNSVGAPARRKGAQADLPFEIRSTKSPAQSGLGVSARRNHRLRLVELETRVEMLRSARRVGGLRRPLAIGRPENLEGYVRSRARGLASRPWRRHISRIERRRGPVGRYGESAAAVLVFEALFTLRGLAGGDRRAVRRRSGGDLGALWRRGSEVVAAEAGQKGAAMARSVSAGGSAAWRWRAIEVEPRLAIMMCHSGRRQPAIGRPGRCAA
jgi:hypothetical protein